jgi:phospholipase/carboxylesterase
VGGALAVQALRRHPDHFAAAAALAGFLTVDAERGDAELAARRPPFLWVRGTQDDVITDSDVARMHAFLPAHTALEERVHPDAGHEITPATAADLTKFLT